MRRKTMFKIGEIATIVGVATLCAALSGCATKTRSVEVDGLFTEAGAGLMALGSVDVMASPIAEESAFVKYAEDNAWLQPSMKLHEIKIMLTGTNSTQNAHKIVKNICEAFIAVKPSVVIDGGEKETK